MTQTCNYRAVLGSLAAVYTTHRDFKTQGKSKSIYNEYLLMACHMLSSVLDICEEFKDAI